MSSEIKLIALDMDGTLLDDDHRTIPPRNVAALRAAAERGVDIALATGRSWSLIREAAEELGCVRYGITGNGGGVVDCRGVPQVKDPMDPRQCAAVIDVLRRHGLSYELYVDGQNYVQADELEGARDFALSPAFLEVFCRNVKLVPDMREFALAVRPEKFDVFYVPPEQREAVVAEIRATGPLACTAALEGNLELTAAHVNKGVALAALAERLGLGPREVMACGDADNDLEMLRWAHWSFAMGNAAPKARAAARLATGRNTEGGVGMAIEKYVLGR